MGTGDVSYGLKDFPAHPWDPKQFDIAVQDDDWLDRQAAELDQAVSAAVGTPGLAVIETARGVIAALRRRRSGDAEAFGEPGRGVAATLVNERGNTISVKAEINADGSLVRTIMVGPTSMVENIMTPKEGLAQHGALGKLMGVRDLATVELDGPESYSTDIDFLYALSESFEGSATGRRLSEIAEALEDAAMEAKEEYPQ